MHGAGQRVTPAKMKPESTPITTTAPEAEDDSASGAGSVQAVDPALAASLDTILASIAALVHAKAGILRVRTDDGRRLQTVSRFGPPTDLSASGSLESVQPHLLSLSLSHHGRELGICDLLLEPGDKIDEQTRASLRLAADLLGLLLYRTRSEGARQESVLARERQNLLNEVHDTVAQTLNYIKMRLPMLSGSITAQDE